MAHKFIDPSCAHEGTLSVIPKENPYEEPPPVTLKSTSLSSELSLPVLAEHCLREIDNFRQGKPYTERYGLELLNRAITQNDQEAWTWMQHCFGGMVQDWVRRHPQRAVACRLESEENYVA